MCVWFFSCSGSKYIFFVVFSEECQRFYWREFISLSIRTEWNELNAFYTRAFNMYELNLIYRFFVRFFRRQHKETRNLLANRNKELIKVGKKLQIKCIGMSFSNIYIYMCV